MKNLGYYNGRINLIENITVPMNDRATASAMAATTRCTAAITSSTASKNTSTACTTPPHCSASMLPAPKRNSARFSVTL